MITISTEVGKFYFTDFVSLGSNESKQIDETALSLPQLKSIRDAYITDRLIVSPQDKIKVETEITNKSQTGGGGKVQSVNGEIGEVVLDASEIDLTTGESIEEKIEGLSPVAFSGSYLDLSNRPGGTGEPFTVLPWNPYREALTSTPFTAANSSTAYSDGHISRKATDSITTYQVELGYPNSPEILVTNGTDGAKTNIKITPTADQVLTKTLAIKQIESVLFTPVDVFPHDGNIKGASLSFLVIQLDEGEDVTQMTVQEITGKSRTISISFNSIYQNEPNDYTTFSYNIIVNGSGVESNAGAINGQYQNLGFKIEDNTLFMANNYVTNLIDYGFDPTKKYAALLICQVNSAAFDVKTPFNITLEQQSSQPLVVNTPPDLVNLTVNKNASLYIGFSCDSNEFFGIGATESFGSVSYNTPVGQINMPSNFIDTNGDITFQYESNEFKLKDVNTGNFITVYAVTKPITYSFISTQGEGNDWYFTITDWKKRLVLDGILPGNTIDGSVLYITNSGKFNGKDLKTGDYIQIYNNKTDFILNRISDPDAIINAKIPTLVGEGLKYENDLLGIKLATTSGLEFINSGELKVKDSFDNKYISYPVLNNRLYEQAVVFNQVDQLTLDLTNNVNIYVYKLYPYGENRFTYIDISTNAFNTAYVMGKTVSMLFTGITSQSYITWPTEFVWANGEVPELSPDKKILVTGIVIGTQWESHTDNKLLCTYSVF